MKSNPKGYGSDSELMLLLEAGNYKWPIGQLKYELLSGESK